MVSREKQVTLDLTRHWLPLTSNRDFQSDPKLFVKAEGVLYFTPNGMKVLDGSSGLFTSPAGHGRKEIADAVHRQLLELDFTSSFQRSHPKAFEAAGKIAELTPDGFDRIFFCNSGSESVDTAMKMALAYHRARGKARARFSSRASGPIMGSISAVSRSPVFPTIRRRFCCGMPQVVRYARYAIRMKTGSLPARRTEPSSQMTCLIQLHGAENIAACVVEPIAGSTGVLVPPKKYLKRLREICDQSGVLLIFELGDHRIGADGQAVCISIIWCYARHHDDG